MKSGNYITALIPTVMIMEYKSSNNYDIILFTGSMNEKIQQQELPSSFHNRLRFVRNHLN